MNYCVIGERDERRETRLLFRLTLCVDLCASIVDRSIYIATLYGTCFATQTKVSVIDSDGLIGEAGGAVQFAVARVQHTVRSCSHS